MSRLAGPSAAYDTVTRWDPVNGEHALRLDRIEASLGDLHEKVDTLVEHEAIHRTEIRWLRWGVRLTLISAAGIGGAGLTGFL